MRNEAKDVLEKLTESVEGKSTLQVEELDKVLHETKKNINKKPMKQKGKFHALQRLSETCRNKPSKLPKQ